MRISVNSLKFAGYVPGYGISGGLIAVGGYLVHATNIRVSEAYHSVC